MASLDGVLLKIEWAEHHIFNLDAEIHRFIESKPYSIGAKLHRIPEISHTTLFIERVDSVPPAIPMIVGDAVHVLRSALDHLAYQLVLANGQAPTTSTYFPIGDPSEEYTARFYGRK